MQELTCFKAYDIRGEIGAELNADIAYRIGRAMAEYLSAKLIVVGGDCRLSTPMLKEAIIEGLRDAHCDVIDIGLCGTEEIYFSTSNLEADGGIMITASHNPKNFNGMKLVREQSKPISSDTGLLDIKALAERNLYSTNQARGSKTYLKTEKAYVEHILSYVDYEYLLPLTIVVNAGNGVAGHIIDAIENLFWRQKVPIEFIKIHHQANGEFPNGIPNPLLKNNRQDTKDAVLLHKANLGLAWDGDFDRCFFFDEMGEFIEGYYIVGLLTEHFLSSNSSEKVIHDPRLTWNTQYIAYKHGGTPIETKTGHAFIKERMRKEDAIYGGEMSAHHYFRDFSYCDSGMIPWLLVIEKLCQSKKTMSQLVKGYIDKFPCSGEINRKVTDPDYIIEAIKCKFEKSATVIKSIDGLSMNFENWRFNLRKSNTEPLLRLNVEVKEDKLLLGNKVADILCFIEEVN